MFGRDGDGRDADGDDMLCGSRSADRLWLIDMTAKEDRHNCVGLLYEEREKYEKIVYLVSIIITRV